MRTPAGSDCPYYYADFYRGRDRQECRLIESTPNGGVWKPDLCTHCAVPRIVLANACPHLVLGAHVTPGVLGLGRRVQVTGSCTRALRSVEEPEIGCGECHLVLPPFVEPTERP